MAKSPSDLLSDRDAKDRDDTNRLERVVDVRLQAQYTGGIFRTLLDCQGVNPAALRALTSRYETAGWHVTGQRQHSPRDGDFFELTLMPRG